MVWNINNRNIIFLTNQLMHIITNESKVHKNLVNKNPFKLNIIKISALTALNIYTKLKILIFKRIFLSFFVK